jgi:hypothetical protein
VLIAGGVVLDYGPDLFGGTPKVAVVVRESADAAKLSQSQIAWINSPALRRDAAKAGISYLVADPNDVDRDGNTPAITKTAIERAKIKGIPRLVLIGPRGGVSDFVLPATEADARKRLGVKP